MLARSSQVLCTFDSIKSLVSGYYAAEMEDNSISAEEESCLAQAYPSWPSLIKTDSRDGQTGKVGDRVQEETAQLGILAQREADAAKS